MSREATLLEPSLTPAANGPLARRSGRFVRRLPLAPTVATLILALFFGAALLAPLIAPYDPRDQDLSRALLPPVWLGSAASTSHLLGTDQLGRDELSRLLWGARVTALVIALAILAAGVAGTIAGLVSGYLGGTVDSVLMRLVDIQLSIPALVLAIALASVLKPGFRNIVVILVIWSWAPFARVVRSDVLAQRSRDYVLQARVVGCTPLRVMYRHILPNVANTILVLVTLDIGRFVVFEAGLSFLGLGVQEPSPAWGSMLAAGRTYVVDAWWLAVIPGVAILLVSLAGNLCGDYITDRLDPRLRGRRKAATG
jgi:peptide/nickel transport system permease protein